MSDDWMVVLYMEDEPEEGTRFGPYTAATARELAHELDLLIMESKAPFEVRAQQTYDDRSVVAMDIFNEHIRYAVDNYDEDDEEDDD
jgi:phospholipid N-methyltransferase